MIHNHRCAIFHSDQLTCGENCAIFIIIEHQSRGFYYFYAFFFFLLWSSLRFYLQFLHHLTSCHFRWKRNHLATVVNCHILLPTCIHVNEAANRPATANNQLKAFAVNETQWNAVGKNDYDKIMQVRIHWVCRVVRVHQCVRAYKNRHSNNINADIYAYGANQNFALLRKNLLESEFEESITSIWSIHYCRLWVVHAWKIAAKKNCYKMEK